MFDYKELIGIPFVQDGRGKQGFDCYGLTQEVFLQHGMDIGEYYCDVHNKQEINKIFREATRKWRKVDYKNGEAIPVPALIGIRFNAPAGVVNHTGVYIGDGKFIHTRERIGVCIERLDSPAWRNQIVGIYEYIGG